MFNIKKQINILDGINNKNCSLTLGGDIPCWKTVSLCVNISNQLCNVSTTIEIMINPIISSSVTQG